MPTQKRGRWWAVLKIDGKAKWLSQHDTEQQARDAEDDVRYELRHRPGQLRAPVATVADLCEDWLESKRPSVGAVTYRDYKGIVELYLVPAYAELRLSDLKATHIHALAAQLNGRAIGDVRRANILRVLTMALNHGVRQEWLRRNVMQGERFVRKLPEREVRALTEAEAKDVLAKVAGTWLDAPVRLALHTGLRLAEVCALQWDDVDLERREITVRHAITQGSTMKAPKNGKTRHVPIDRPTVALLRALPRGTWVFTGQRAEGNVRPSSLSHAFSVATGRKFHDLRHTHASWLLRAGTDLMEVSQRLGHSDVTITGRVYAHYLPGRGHKAADTFARVMARVG
jgi:integrase